MPDKVTAPEVRAMKNGGRRVVCVTAYDAVTGALVDEAGVDIALVGDSVGNVVLGYSSTIPVSLDEMARHTAAAARGVRRALLVADMPFGSYQSSPAQAVESAVTLVKAGAEAVKIEGAYCEAAGAILRAGIPVMGHVGMTPQSVHAFGGHRVQGKGESGKAVLRDAQALDEVGVFAIVLELVPRRLAAEITECVGAVTIGIGAGPDCDGQVQVFHDIMGLSERPYRHSKVFTNGRESFLTGLRAFAEEVREGAFPGEEHSF